MEILKYFSTKYCQTVWQSGRVFTAATTLVLYTSCNLLSSVYNFGNKMASFQTSNTLLSNKARNVETAASVSHKIQDYQGAANKSCKGFSIDKLNSLQHLIDVLKWDILGGKNVKENLNVK